MPNKKPLAANFTVGA